MALVIRASFFLQYFSSPLFGQLFLDQKYYDLSARQLAGTDIDMIDGFRPLLYPLFLSLFYRISAVSGMLLSMIAQMALGIGITVLVATLAMRVFKNTVAGIIAGLLFCLSAPPLYFEGQLLITTLFSFLLLLLSYVVFQALESNSHKKSAFLWTTAGIILGLSAQARPNALPLILFFPLLTIYRLWRNRTAKMNVPQAARLPRTIAALPLIAIPGLLIIQTLFGAINATYSGQFSLMTQAGGINFYLGNSKKADGMIPRQDRHVIYTGEYRDPIQVMAEQGYHEATGERGSVSQKDISNHWKQKTISDIKEAPTRWLHLMAKKTWLMFWNHEVPNNRSFSFAATQDTPLLRVLPVRWWLLLFLFPWGIAALKQRNATEQILWICSFFILFSGTIVLFFVNSRFRIPLWPLMAVVAGGGSIHLWSAIKTKIIPKAPLIFSLILLPGSLINWFGIPPDSIENDLSMRASAYSDCGQYKEALEDIFQCLEIAPKNPRYHFTLGNILLASEDYSTAIQAYRTALDLNDKDPMFYNNLGIAYESAGDFESADRAYHDAIELQPHHMAARINGLLLSIRTDQMDPTKQQTDVLINRISPKPDLVMCRGDFALPGNRKFSGTETGRTAESSACRTVEIKVYFRKRGHPLEVPVKHKTPFHGRFSTACWFSFFVDRFYVNFHR